jgi:hypothetical protein
MTISQLLVQVLYQPTAVDPDEARMTNSGRGDADDAEPASA